MRPVTADTNVYISALNFGGTPLQFIELARSGMFRLAISPPIRLEVHRVLLTKFAWPESDINDALSDLELCTDVFHPAQTLRVIASDPTDDRILECALAAGSDFIVSGDNHLLQLVHYRGTRILKAADFLAELSR